MDILQRRKRDFERFVMKSRLEGEDRSSRPELFCEKDVLRNSAKFTLKHLCQSLIFNKVAEVAETASVKR